MFKINLPSSVVKRCHDFSALHDKKSKFRSGKGDSAYMIDNLGKPYQMFGPEASQKGFQVSCTRFTLILIYAAVWEPVWL